MNGPGVYMGALCHLGSVCGPGPVFGTCMLFHFIYFLTLGMVIQVIV